MLNQEPLTHALTNANILEPCSTSRPPSKHHLYWSPAFRTSVSLTLCLPNLYSPDAPPSESEFSLRPAFRIPNLLTPHYLKLNSLDAPSWSQFSWRPTFRISNLLTSHLPKHNFSDISPSETQFFWNLTFRNSILLTSHLPKLTSPDVPPSQCQFSWRPTFTMSILLTPHYLKPSSPDVPSPESQFSWRPSVWSPILLTRFLPNLPVSETMEQINSNYEVKHNLYLPLRLNSINDGERYREEDHITFIYPRCCSQGRNKSATQYVNIRIESALISSGYHYLKSKFIMTGIIPPCRYKSNKYAHWR